jgi:transcription elongation factor Elf1
MFVEEIKKGKNKMNNCPNCGKKVVAYDDSELHTGIAYYICDKCRIRYAVHFNSMSGQISGITVHILNEK